MWRQRRIMPSPQGVIFGCANIDMARSSSNCCVYKPQFLAHFLYYAVSLKILAPFPFSIA